MEVSPGASSHVARGIARPGGEGRDRRTAVTFVGVLFGISIVAWISTYLVQAGMGSAGMVMMATGQGPWGVAYFVAVWAVMMVAMMFPAAAGMIRTFVGLSRTSADSSREAVALSSVFVGAYVGIWSTFGLGIAGLYTVLPAVVPDLASSGHVAAPLVGAILVVAGVYQFTPLKSVCLRGCQSPFSFLMRRWRSGLRGSLSMGVRHAAYCVGCCWALFLVLFAVGVMSLPWMALLATVVFAEKSFARGERLAWGVGVVFLLAGVVFVLWPAAGSWTLG